MGENGDSGHATTCVKCGEVYEAVASDGSRYQHFCEGPTIPPGPPAGAEPEVETDTPTLLAPARRPAPTAAPPPGPPRRTPETSRSTAGERTPMSSETSRLNLSITGTKNIPQEALAVAQDLAHVVGPYILVKEIGKGGMGAVWKAWDTKLSRWVAIKFLSGTSQEVTERFHREARVTASVRHPNIATIFDVGDARGQPFIAMEFVDGCSLDKHTAPLGELVDIMRQVANAIEAAHKAGIIHRDLKPQNIMINRSGWPFVLDFGLAKQVEGGQSGLSVSGQIMGTPAYMPPEQAQGNMKEIDARSDVYSLGATLYWLVTRQPPFKEASPIETIMKVVNDDPTPPKKIVPSCPDELNTIILKAMEKDPARRYQKAEELAEDLRRFRSDESLIARPPSLSFRLFKNVRRNKLSYALATTVALAAIAVTTLAFVKRPPPSDSSTFEKLWRDARRSIGFLDYRGGQAEPEKFDAAFASLALLDASYVVHATEWFREQERGADERLKDWRGDRARWIEHRAEEERIASWAREVDGVLAMLEKRVSADATADLRARFAQIGSEAASMAAYRGQASVGVLLMPFARLKSLSSGDVVLVKDGQAVSSQDVKFADADLVTPFSMVDLEIRDYEAVFDHPQLGERKVAIRADQLRHGGEYVISGQMAKPESITLK